jgi:hypothetical protein
MNGKLAAIGGLTIGAMTMYFLDSNQGKRLRTSVFDRTSQFTRLSKKAAGRTIRNVGNRVSGLRRDLTTWMGRTGVGSGLGIGTKSRSSKPSRARHARRLRIA